MLLIFCLSFTVSVRAVRPAEEIKRVKADQILDTKQFNYLDKGSIITLQIVLPEQDKVVFESLMRIESTDKELYNLILSRSPQAGTELLWVCNSEVEKVRIGSPKDSIRTDTMSVGFSVRFPADSVYISANEHSYAFSSHGIRSDRGYRFHILGDKRSHLKLVEGHAELLSIGKEGNHAPGELATTELRLTSTNDTENVYYLSYHIDAGTGIVAIDGVERNPDTPYPLFSGNGTVTADISYTQAEPGDVRLRLTVTDKYGFSMERVLTTGFKNPELTITYTQQGNELTVYDRAYIDYTVSQPGYSGNYTVKVEGVPSVYYGRYGSDVPLTTFTQYGNGSYTLRVKPNMVGPNPLKITVTDADGHSAEIITSVMGIKATADLKPTFSTSSGLLYVTVESSQPVVDDLTVKVTANADIYSFGGTVTKKQYIVTVKIEADHTTGKGSVSLSGLGSYATFTVASYTAEFKRTSDNGLVEYKLQ